MLRYRGIDRSDVISLMCTALAGTTSSRGVGSFNSAPALPYGIIILLVEQKKVKIHFISFYIIYMYVFPALVAKRQNVIWVAGIKSNSIIHYYKILLELLAVLYIRYVRWSCRGTPI